MPRRPPAEVPAPRRATLAEHGRTRQRMSPRSSRGLRMSDPQPLFAPAKRLVGDDGGADDADEAECGESGNAGRGRDDAEKHDRGNGSPPEQAACRAVE